MRLKSAVGHHTYYDSVGKNRLPVSSRMKLFSDTFGGLVCYILWLEQIDGCDVYSIFALISTAYGCQYHKE